MEDDLDRLEGEYEAAEAAFLSAIRKDALRTAVADAAAAVAAAAEAWNAEAYRRFHSSKADERERLNLLTEVTEVLSDLWKEISLSYAA